jgi:hypothetical protein
MIVIPTAFNTTGAKMLQAAKSLVEDKDNLVLIDKRFDKLLTALRTAVAREYKLDKEQTSYHDILDAFRLSLQLYERKNTWKELIRDTQVELFLPTTIR